MLLKSQDEAAYPGIAPAVTEYLERRPDAHDGRSKRIVLTDRGERAAYTIRDAVKDIERDWEAKLGRERFAHLKALLVELNQPA